MKIAKSNTVRQLLVLGFVGLPLLLLAADCIRTTDLTLEQRAFRLEQQILCPICQGQTINESQSQLAQDMRTLLRGKLEEGLTDQQVLDEFATIYGTTVLASPKASGLGLVAWVTPIAIGGLALIILVVVARDLKRPASTPTLKKRPHTEERAQLKPYLERVERDLDEHR